MTRRALFALPALAAAQSTPETSIQWELVTVTASAPRYYLQVRAYPAGADCTALLVTVDYLDIAASVEHQRQRQAAVVLRDPDRLDQWSTAIFAVPERIRVQQIQVDELMLSGYRAILRAA